MKQRAKVEESELNPKIKHNSKKAMKTVFLSLLNTVLYFSYM